MKIKGSSFIAFLVVLAVSTFFLGCEEPELGSRRRIRLVGDENLKLKEQLKVCNQQIQKLEEVIAEYETKEQKRADTDKETGDIIIKLLRDNDAARNEIERLTNENQKLETKIGQLESELAQNDD